MLSHSLLRAQWSLASHLWRGQGLVLLSELPAWCSALFPYSSPQPRPLGPGTTNGNLPAGTQQLLCETPPQPAVHPARHHASVPRPYPSTCKASLVLAPSDFTESRTPKGRVATYACIYLCTRGGERRDVVFPAICAIAGPPETTLNDRLCLCSGVLMYVTSLSRCRVPARRADWSQRGACCMFDTPDSS